MQATWPLTIYYDASCPLCREEMQALAAMDTGSRLRLQDISGDDAIDDHCREAGLDQPALMGAIHARDAAGRWFRAIDVFELAYAAAGLEGVARLWGHSRLRRLWDSLYPWVARHRQALSRLRLDRPYGWLIRRAARRAQRRADTCAEGLCMLPEATDPAADTSRAGPCPRD